MKNLIVIALSLLYFSICHAQSGNMRQSFQIEPQMGLESKRQSSQTEHQIGSKRNKNENGGSPKFFDSSSTYSVMGGNKKQEQNNNNKVKFGSTGHNIQDARLNRIRQSNSTLAIKNIGKIVSLTSIPYYTGSQLEEERNSQYTKGFNEGMASIINGQNTDNSEYAYYLHVVKKNGWWVGIGPKLTEKQRSHVSCSYKLSLKNKAGNWTLLQAYDGYGNLTTSHSIGTYLVNQSDGYDTGSNKDWKKKIEDACQWLSIGNNTGEKVVAEQALDRDNTIIYSYFPIKIGNNSFVGSFVDEWGMPIYMRTDSLGHHEGYANYVQILWDENGYETLLSFVDEKGYPQKNKDGAYMTQRIFDSNGNEIREASLNIVGNQINDLCGNCGWENTYNDYGCILTAKYFDADNKPIRMPGTRGSNQVYGYEFEYDKYNREICRWYLDENGQRNLNENGAYCRKTEYDEHGNVMRYAAYDREGKLALLADNGVAVMDMKYNNMGRITSLNYYGTDSKPINGFLGYCTDINKYTEDGYNYYELQTYIKDGFEQKMFEMEKDFSGNFKKVWYDDDLVRIDSVDVKGRKVLTAYYDLEMNPRDYDTDYARHETTYRDGDGYSIEVEKYFDKDGELSWPTGDRDWSIGVVETDSVAKRKVKTQYFYKDLLRQKFVQEFNDDFSDIIAQWDVTEEGEQARAGWFGNLHYKTVVDRTMYGDFRSFVGKNEFEEPSYLVELHENGDVYYFKTLNGAGNSCYDENGDIIPSDSMQVFKNNLPKVFCIEVTDTAIAYPLGLRNGDIILSYGEWIIEEDLKSNVNQFYLETILESGSTKKMVVLRHDLIKRTSNIVTLDLPTGQTSEMGFYPHLIYYTQKEAQRLYSTCRHYNYNLTHRKIKGGKTVLMTVQTKGQFANTRFYHLPQYDIKDPGFLLYMKEEYSKGENIWCAANSDAKQWKEKDMFNPRFSGKTTIYLTTNFKDIKKASKSSSGNRGLRVIPIEVSEDIYIRIKNYYKENADRLPKDYIVETEPIEKKKINIKTLYGTWQTSVKEDDFIGTISLVLSKKSIACFEIGCNYISNNSYGAHFNISIPAEWRLKDKILCLNLLKNDSKFDITAINVSGLDDEKKDDFLLILKDFLETSKDELIEKLIKNIQEDLTIKSVDKNQLIVQDNKGVVFKKVYNNEKKDVQWINLGLSSGTLWATKNVGAISPSDYGFYYAWGETAIKDSYKWETLKYCVDADGNNFSKYVVDSIHGSIDNKYELEINDDAAYQNLGKSWRIPTYMQLEELVKDCIWTWTTMNGHHGYEIVGPNGKSIFLPANGYRIDDTLNAVDDKGYYLSRTLDKDDSRTIYYHNFTPTEKSKYGRYYRYPGFGVRAVYEGR